MLIRACRRARLRPSGVERAQAAGTAGVLALLLAQRMQHASLPPYRHVTVPPHGSTGAARTATARIAAPRTAAACMAATASGGGTVPGLPGRRLPYHERHGCADPTR